MDSLLIQLQKPIVWHDFLNYKLEKGHLLPREQQQLSEYIKTHQYLPLAQKIIEGGSFSLPQKKLINKLGNKKKRVVYHFADEEVMFLKALSFLLYKYDCKQSPNCYSFRRGCGAHHAIHYLTDQLQKTPMWGYKLDIHNYFNTISIPILLPILQKLTEDDPLLYNFFEQLLNNNQAYFEGQIVEESRGAMAGTPISPFLANIYLTEIDHYFYEHHIIYVRYSDDIIVFAPSYKEILGYKKILLQFLEKYQLIINQNKEKIIEPDEPWEFLGIQCHLGKIDLSESTKRKLKGKIRRKARSLRRWMLYKKASPNQAMKTLIKIFNRKFFEMTNPNDLTWSRWFFPIVNQISGFKEIDAYLQQNIRYINSGRYKKTNYNVRYKTLKELGYRSLVNEYHKFLKK